MPLPPLTARAAYPPTRLPADHNSRTVGQISLVDEHERVLCNLFVRPEVPVVSYLTPLTGLTAQLLAQHGMPLAQAVAVLQQYLPPNAILVGQNIAKDVEWLGLKEGQHFEQARHLCRQRCAALCKQALPTSMWAPACLPTLPAGVPVAGLPVAGRPQSAHSSVARPSSLMLSHSSGRTCNPLAD